jgi:hypothetical protein
MCSRLDSLDGGSAVRKAATYTQNNTKTDKTHTDIYGSRWIRTHDPRAKTVHTLDRAATVIGRFYNYKVEYQEMVG